MYQLSYSSKASQEITDKGIESILESARKRNRVLGVTGCLVFHKFSFVQIIEGNESLRSVFKFLNVDRRLPYSGVEKIDFGHVA